MEDRVITMDSVWNAGLFFLTVYRYLMESLPVYVPLGRLGHDARTGELVWVAVTGKPVRRGVTGAPKSLSP